MTDKAQARIIIGVALIGVFLLVAANLPISSYSYGVKLTAAFPVAVTLWFIYLKYAIPRCPKCNYTVISVLEIKGFPVLTKMPVGGKCSWCGQPLN